MSRLRAVRDPFWDMDGQSVRHERKRDRTTAVAAFVIAVTAAGLAAVAWLDKIVSILGSIHFG